MRGKYDVSTMCPLVFYLSVLFVFGGGWWVSLDWRRTEGTGWKMVNDQMGMGRFFSVYFMLVFYFSYCCELCLLYVFC